MVLTYSRLYQFLFAACIFVSYSNNYEIIFLVWFLALMTSVAATYSRTILLIAASFAGICAIAAFSSLFYSSTLYAYIRDMTYLLKPLIGILAGYQLFKKIPKEKALHTIVMTGIVIALVHMSVIFITFMSLKTVNLNILREYGGYFSDYEVYVLILLMFSRKFGLTYTRKQRMYYLVLIAVSSFLYLSRTNFIQFAILLIGMMGYFVLNRRALSILTTFIIAAVLGYTAISLSNPRRNGKGMEAFLYKIKIAPVEAFKTKINKENWQDFNDNFRSYENILVLRQVSTEGTQAVISGKGLGSSIDLGMKYKTNDGEDIIREPFVHNGYLTVYLKSGILGVFLVVLTIFSLFKKSHSRNVIALSINRLLVATGIFLVFSYWVFLGLYFRADSKAILIGFLIAMMDYFSRREPQISES